MEILQILKANNVALNQMVDIRSNPALRAQIQAVVRRAAEQQAPAAQPAPAAAAPAAAAVVTPPTIATRLQELKDLHASGALTDDEYNSRRAAIISEI
jgi:pyruvate/2-oxoglutarate dehydrogenase complex dihydrolipoamide acyltransferase (E2) component